MVDSDGTKYYCWLAVVSLVALYNIIVVSTICMVLDDFLVRLKWSWFSGADAFGVQRAGR